jgi:hypothetical protein
VKAHWTLHIFTCWSELAQVFSEVNPTVDLKLSNSKTPGVCCYVLRGVANGDLGRGRLPPGSWQSAMADWRGLRKVRE